MFRRLGSSLAQQRASLSSELGSLWELLRERRRSAPAPAPAPAPSRLARDLLQVVQETVFAKKYDERRCPLVKEESDLSSDEGNDRRIANLIDFFFTIVKSQKDERKSSSGSCFKTESPTEVKPRKVNSELEKKMETLMEFLATTGCMEESKDDKKITLMEFLFGPENKPLSEINHHIARSEMTLSESKINVKLAFIDETPVEEGSDLVDMLMKYMENYEKEPAKCILTPSLSEKSKSDVTISKIETFSDISKTKSDSTLTHTQETVIERDERSDKSYSRRISETVVDLSNVKQDLEDIFTAAVAKVLEMSEIEKEKQEQNDTMSEAEDMQNFHSYTKPPLLYNIQYMPYSAELSDIIEEDESLDPSYRGNQDDRMMLIRHCAEDLLDYIEDRVESHFEDDSSEDEFDLSDLKRLSISLIDLRSIPDLPPSMIIKPKVIRVDKSTSTTEISDSISDIYRRTDSCCMTEDTSLSNSSERQAERALDKLESLHKFFSRSRTLEIINESHEEYRTEKKQYAKGRVIEVNVKTTDLKPGQASLDDVEELQDEVSDNPITEVILEENDREVNEENEFQDDVNDNFVHNVEPNDLHLDDKLDDSTINSVDIELNSPREGDLGLNDHFYTDAGFVGNDKTCQKVVKRQSQIDNEAKILEADEINETDFTEIDKIIAEAVKLILANELEFYEQNKEMKVENSKKAKSNIDDFDFDKDIVNIKSKRKDLNK